MNSMVTWLKMFALAAILALGAGVAQAQDDMPAGDSPTYYADVQPILAAHCLGCHTAGGIAPFSLETPELAQARAAAIAEAVSARVMPPWMPGPDNPPFKGERTLTPAEIDTLVAWRAAGAPAGSVDEAVAVEVARPTLRADLVLEMPDAYTPDAVRHDDYRCFLLDPDLPADRFIAGYTIEPGQRRIVHHVVLFQVDERARAEAMARAAEDDRPGWTCFGGPGVSGSDLGETVGTWTPGTFPTFYPEGTGRPLRADGLVVMQVHYNLHGQDPAPDRTWVVFQLANVGERVIPLVGMALFAPVEIPCPAGSDSPACDRAAAVASAPPGDRDIAAWQLRQCGKTPADYTSQDASHVVSTCDYPVQDDALLVDVLGHMHTLGKTFTLELNPGTDRAQTLLYIPQWDFHWQGTYQYAEPIPVRQGDVIRITCVWDNSGGDRYIIWGEGTEDEMCIGLLTIQPPARP